jgi:hypothetical protein
MRLFEEQAVWEREDLMPAHDRLVAEPSSALSIEEVERNLEAKRLQRATLWRGSKLISNRE